MTAFELIILGCSGGPKENNLSGYLLAPSNQKSYVALDGGTLLHGMAIAKEKGHFGSSTVLDVFQNQIKGYLISHPHLDHLAGLVIGSQVDVAKSIYGTDFTIDVLRDHLFNGFVWPNYGSEGKNPINQYSYRRIKSGEKYEIQNTQMTFEMYPLRHSQDCSSTAFLLESKGDYLLYFGDTTSDGGHDEKKLEPIWKRVAPLIKEKKLKGLLLECSYPKGLKGPAIRSHLDTETLLFEMRALAKIAGNNLEGIQLVVTHRKGGLAHSGDFTTQIAEELTRDNDLGLKFIFPSQGQRYVL